MPSALVTGGSSGIGLAIARMLHEEGFVLTLVARSVDRLAAAGAELGCRVVAADVADEGDCERIVAAHVAAHGGLDVLVNSAGVGVGGPAAETATRHWDLQHGVNLRGAFLVTRAALPHLRLTRGLVVNLASIAGTIAAPGLAAYGASKAGLIGLTQSLDREEADSGVRFSALCPAYVDTRMAAWTGIPGEEMIQPEDCAEVVRTLLRLSPSARIPVIVIERAGGSI